MIRTDSISLATEPMDLRAGTETALARVIAVFGAAKPTRILGRTRGVNSRAFSRSR